jgi:hypothetical protein
LNSRSAARGDMRDPVIIAIWVFSIVMIGVLLLIWL